MPATSRRRRARAPAITYDTSAVPAAADESTAVRAKLFPNGRSQAVRLPKEFRMPGSEVRIWREGKRVVMEPLDEEPVDAKGWPIGFWDEIDRLAQGVDFPDVEPLGARLLEPEEFER